MASSESPTLNLKIVYGEAERRGGKIEEVTFGLQDGRLRLGDFFFDLRRLGDLPFEAGSRRRQERERLGLLLARSIAGCLGLSEGKSLGEVVAAAGGRLPFLYTLLAAKKWPEEDPDWGRFEDFALQCIGQAQPREGTAMLLLLDLIRESRLPVAGGRRRAKEKRPANADLLGPLTLHILYLIQKGELRRSVAGVFNLPESFFSVDDGARKVLPSGIFQELTFNPDQAARALVSGSFAGTSVYEGE